MHLTKKYLEPNEVMQWLIRCCADFLVPQQPGFDPCPDPIFQEEKNYSHSWNGEGGNCGR